MKDELEMIWKEAAAVLSRHVPARTERNCQDLTQLLSCLALLGTYLFRWTVLLPLSWFNKPSIWRWVPLQDCYGTLPNTVTFRLSGIA